MSHVYKETKKYYERERRKTLVVLWLANVTMSPTTMSPKCYPLIDNLIPYLELLLHSNLYKILPTGYFSIMSLLGSIFKDIFIAPMKIFSENIFLVVIEIFYVLVSLAQLVWTMHNICKVRGSNPGHQKKKIIEIFYEDIFLVT